MSAPWIYAILIVGGTAAVFVAVVIMGRFGGRRGADIEDEHARIARLSTEEARAIARTVLGDQHIFRLIPASSPLRVQQDFGAVTKEFFDKYERVESLNGAVVISRDEIRASEYNPSYTRIGRSDYADVVVAPPHDAVSEIDGSESAPRGEESFASIYHWIVSIASDLDPRSSRL